MINFIKYQIKNNLNVIAFLVINIIIPIVFSLILINIKEISLASDEKIVASQFSLLYSISFVAFIFSASYWFIAKPRRISNQDQILSKYQKIAKITKKNIKIGNLITDIVLSIWIIILPILIYILKTQKISQELMIIFLVLIVTQIVFYLLSEIILIFILNKKIQIKNLTIIFLVFTFFATAISKLSISEWIKDSFLLNIFNTIFKNNFIDKQDVINLLPFGVILVILALILMMVRSYFEKTNK